MMFVQSKQTNRQAGKQTGKSANDAPKIGEIRYGKVDLSSTGAVHKYVGVHPYLVVSNDTYNKCSGQCEVIPFTTKRAGSTNPVHVTYVAGEVEGLDRDSTLVIEGRDTLRNEQLSSPVGKFTPENWVRAVQAMLVQCPAISMVLDATQSLQAITQGRQLQPV